MPRFHAAIIFVLWCCCTIAASAQAGNLALGAKVEFVVPPNYHYSRDANDAMHLVDGLPKAGARSYLAWTNPDAVGWSYRMAAFVIDFGKPVQVGCVVIRSKHCERVGVLPPHDVKVYAADDPEVLQLIAQSGNGPAVAVPAVPKGEDAGPFRAVVNTVPYRTRRLAIVMRAVKTLSIDEVEVLPASLSAGAAPGLSQAKAVPLEEAYAPLLGSRVDVSKLLRQARVVAALKWGKLSAGPLRALFVLPAASVRDAAELAHRVEIEPSVVPFYYNGALDPVAAVKLKKALRGKHEVCIVGGLAWDRISEDVQAAMLDAVRSRSMGILWVDSSRKTSIELPGEAAETPLVSAALSDMAATLSPKVWVKAYRLGPGRVAVVRMSGGNKVPPTTLLPIVGAEKDMVGMPRWEACCAGLLRSALWAAGRVDSPLALRVRGSDVLVAPTSTSADRLRVRWLDRYWSTLSDEVVGAGDSLLISHLPRGTNACAVAALDRDGRVLDLAMVGVPGREIARISRIAALPQPLDPLAPGKALLTIESSRLRAVVNVEVYDPWGRLICDQVSEVELKEGTNEIGIDLSGLNRSPRAVSLLIEAVVAAEGHVLDRARLHVALKQQRRPAFFFQEWSGMSWWGANSSAGLAMMAEEQRLGVDAATYYGVFDSTIRPRLAHNIRVNPLGFGRVHVKSTELRNPIRKPPLHDPEYVDKLTKKMLRQVETAAVCQPDCVISGDEQSIGW